LNKKKLALLAALILLVIGFFALDLGRFFSLDYVKAARGDFAALYESRPALVLGVFFAVYVAVTALSLPGAAIMTLLGGAIFGLWIGTLVVSFASSLGATLAMLVSRYVLRDSVKAASARGWPTSTAACSAMAPSTCSRCAWCRCSPSSSSTC
jgi:uncharacterized membrane protein YdjX (TVP38/TMEM64 family)